MATGQPVFSRRVSTLWRPYGDPAPAILPFATVGNSKEEMNRMNMRKAAVHTRKRKGYGWSGWPLVLPVLFTTSCWVHAQTEQTGDQEPKVEISRIGKRDFGEDWSWFLGPNRNGVSSEKGIRTDWEADPPEVLWKWPLGTSYGIGTTTLGRYLQFDRRSNEAVVNCLNAETGEELWEYTYASTYVDLYGYDGGPRCSPIIDEHRVYVYGAEGELHCLNLRDGSLLWKVNTFKDFGVVQNFFGVGSNPVVDGDLLLCMVGGSPPSAQQVPPGQLDLLTGNGSGIVAFDKKTGKVVYKISEELASYASLTLSEIRGQTWCFAFLRGGLLAFKTQTSETQHFYPWRSRKLESVNASTPIVVGDEVLISETYGPGAALLKLTEQGFEEIWTDEDKGRDKSLQTHWNTPVYHDGYVYASSGRHTENAELRCVEWKTGKVMWSVPQLTRCSLTMVDDHLICLGEYGRLRLLRPNPQEFEQLAVLYLKREDSVAQQFQLDSPLLRYPCWAAPIVSHGLLYLRGARQLVCLELKPVAR